MKSSISSYSKTGNKGKMDKSRENTRRDYDIMNLGEVIHYRIGQYIVARGTRNEERSPPPVVVLHKTTMHLYKQSMEL